jgi:hypothetical protein
MSSYVFVYLLAYCFSGGHRNRSQQICHVVAKSVYLYNYQASNKRILCRGAIIATGKSDAIGISLSLGTEDGACRPIFQNAFLSFMVIVDTRCRCCTIDHPVRLPHHYPIVVRYWKVDFVIAEEAVCGPPPAHSCLAPGPRVCEGLLLFQDMLG